MSQNTKNDAAATKLLGDMVTVWKASETAAAKALVSFGRLANRFVKLADDKGQSLKDAAEAITDHLEATLRANVDKGYISRSMSAYALVKLLDADGGPKAPKGHETWETAISACSWFPLSLAFTLVKRWEAKERKTGCPFHAVDEFAYDWSFDGASKAAAEWIGAAASRAVPSARDECRATFGKLVKEHGGKVKGNDPSPRTPAAKVATGLASALSRGKGGRDESQDGGEARKEGIKAAVKERKVTVDDVVMMIKSFAAARDSAAVTRFKNVSGLLLEKMGRKRKPVTVRSKAAADESEE